MTTPEHGAGQDNPYINILDETNQMIQISNRHSFEMLYANKPALQFAVNAGQPYKGQKCYWYMMGLDGQCPFCPMREIGAQESFVAEVDNSVQVFTVKTQLIEWDGQESFIEYATDITVIKRAQERYKGEMDRLLASISEAQGIFHLNLTKGQCVGAHGASAFVEELSGIQDVDELIEASLDFIQSEKEQKEYRRRFCREALMRAYDNGKTEVTQEAEFLIDTGEVHWSRITARLMTNPTTGNLECILYGIDINDEVKYRNSMEVALRDYERLEDEAKRDVLTGVYSKKAFEQLSGSFLDEKPEGPFAIVFIDIDYFKNINDSLGHLIGDYVIIDVARKLQVVFPETDIVSRFGGDEFCVLARTISRAELGRKLDWLVEKLRKTYRNEEKKVDLTCSVGAVHCEAAEGRKLYDLMYGADKALYRAKAEGRDRYVIADVT